jgi:hypothetical protein
MLQTPYYHVGGGWFRPNLTFDPAAAGFGLPPPTGAEDATMKNPATARAALMAPSKKKVKRKVQKKGKSVRRRGGRVNLTTSRDSEEMQT